MSLQESPLLGWRIAHNDWRRRHLIDRFCDAFELTSRPAKKMRKIAAEVAAKHGLGVDRLFACDRSRPVARARQEAYYRCRMETHNALTTIGRMFGRDHTTVLSGIRRHAARMAGEGKLP